MHLVDAEAWLETYEKQEDKIKQLEQVCEASMRALRRLVEELDREKQARLDAELYADILTDRLNSRG